MRNGAFYNFHHIDPGHGTSRRAGFSYMFPSAGDTFDCHAADRAVDPALFGGSKTFGFSQGFYGVPWPVELKDSQKESPG